MWLLDVADRRNLASINVSRPDLQATKYLAIDESDKFKLSLFKVPSCLNCSKLKFFSKGAVDGVGIKFRDILCKIHCHENGEIVCRIVD
jgi:hypothetical protein